jgi:hypothetical protein
MAVAIWDHEPDADALLARRVARGWTPRPTVTRDGDVVLGHAACLADGGTNHESRGGHER